VLQVSYDGRCFGCGIENPLGLQMHFQDLNGESVCEFKVDARFQSWEGMVHGGIVALMLDEAVGWVGWHAGFPGVTAKLEVRYRQPLLIDDRVRVVGRLESVRRRLVRASATIGRIEDDSVIAEALATLMSTPAAVRNPQR